LLLIRRLLNQDFPVDKLKSSLFTVAIMTCFTVTYYQCHRWLRICSVCRSHKFLLLYLLLFVGGLLSYLCHLCLLTYSGVQHILCFVFLRLVYPMLPVSLDCPFLIATTIFSNVYLSSHLSFRRSFVRRGFLVGCVLYLCIQCYIVTFFCSFGIILLYLGVKSMFVSRLLPIVHAQFMLFVYSRIQHDLYITWCSCLSPVPRWDILVEQEMLPLSGVPVFTPDVAISYVSCVEFCKSLFVCLLFSFDLFLFVITLFVLLRFTASDYPMI